MKLILAALLSQDVLEDFERREQLDTIADGWERVRSDDHPAYNRIEVVRDPAAARSGDHFLRLRTLGGWTALRRTAAWPVDPDRSYQFGVSVRLLGRKANAARAELLWLDEAGRVLGETSTARLERADEWTELAVDVPRVPAGTRRLAVVLAYEGPDVSGECHFDRLTLASRPRIDVSPADRPLPVYEPGTPPRLTILAPAGGHEVAVDIIDPAGERIGPTTRAPIASGAPVTVELPPLPAGFHLALVTVGETRRLVPLAAPNPWRSNADSRVVHGAFEPSAPGELARLAGFRHARVALSPGIDDLLRDLAKAGVAVTGVLTRPAREHFPAASRAVLDRGFAALLRRDRAAWEPALRALLERHGAAISSWEMSGANATTIALAGGVLKGIRPSAAETLAAASPGELLRALIGRAAAGMPPAWLPVEGERSLGLLVAARAANDVLSGAVYRKGAHLFAPPARDFVFEMDGRLVLAAWCEEGEVEHEAFLGPDAEIYPPLGAVRPVRAGERLRIGALPVFITGIDPRLLETQLSLQLVDAADPQGPPGVLPLAHATFTRRFTMKSGFPQGDLTDVRLRLAGPPPPGWMARPSAPAAGPVAPGALLAMDWQFHLPPGETEGAHELALELSFRHEGREHLARVRRRIRVEAGLAVSIASSAGEGDFRRVTVTIANRSGRAVKALAQVRITDQPEHVEPLGVIERDAARTLEYGAKAGARVEVICEERDGALLHARRSAEVR
jgi:hypothetical protein